MSYQVMGQLFNTRRDALTHLVAEFVSAGGENDLDDVTRALHEQNIGDTAGELLDSWGDGETVSVGEFEEPADHNELVRHMTTRGADIIGVTDPADVRARREAKELAAK